MQSDLNDAANGSIAPAASTLQTTVESIRTQLAGPAVLLPIPSGEKGPCIPGWQHRTLADMQRPEYLASLNHGGNVGVLLGAASSGLCALDFDTDADANTFLAANQKLGGSFRTRGARGCQVWVRMCGGYPPSCNIKDATGRKVCEWRADSRQSIIWGKHPTGVNYQWQVDAPPLETAFEEINWLGDWRLPWMPEPELPADPEQELTKRQGAAFTVSERGRVTLNPMWIVGRYLAEHDVLFEPDEGRFYTYHADAGLWRPETVAALNVQIANDLKRFADGQEADVAEQIVNARTHKFLAGLTALLQGYAERREVFRRRPKVVHVANGMLHLDTEQPELRPFGTEYLSRNAAPIAFDPAADCPRFRAELLDAALAPDDVSLVQRYAGALLLGRNLAQRILVLTGTAGGGKSTLLELIERVVGLENVGQLRTDLLAERFEVARFIGRTLLTGKDVAGRFLETTGAHVLKALVGHDLLDAERKGSNASFQVRGDFGVVITCNSRLRVRLDGDTEAWRRRLLIIKYERLPPERPERDFAAKLLASEGPGILRWLVDGARAHLEELETTGEFTLTPRQRSRVDALLAESDSVREFIRRCVERCAEADASVSELVEAYMAFCEDMGWEPLGVRSVENALADAMQEICRVARRNDIKRGGSSKKGFKGARIIKAEGAVV